MSTAENAKLNIEAGQNPVAMNALTPDGTFTIYTASGSPQFSSAEGAETVVAVDGLTTGGVITPTPSTNDSVDFSSLTYTLAGSIGVSLAGASIDLSTQRAAITAAVILSITIDSGGAIDVVSGADGTLDPSGTRGGAGAPPSIPVGSIEIGQVHLTGNTAAQVLDTEIFQVTGLHVERSTFPVYTISNRKGTITFITGLQIIHNNTATAAPTSARAVQASYFTPIFAEVPDASDFVPPETSDSSTSTQVYGRTVSATNSTLNQGTFNALLDNGVTDLVIQLKGQNLWFEFYPNRFSTSNSILTQGKLGVTRSFPADDLLSAACTITAEEEAQEVTA